MARSLEQVGDGWSLLLLREALLGVRRFQDFQERLGVAPNTLSRRLVALTEQGILEKRRYDEHPPRDGYELTQKGRELAPLLMVLSTWGNRWLSPKGALLEWVDPATGTRVEPLVVDEHTLKPLSAGNVALQAGPGASAELRRSFNGGHVLFGAGSSENGGDTCDA